MTAPDDKPRRPDTEQDWAKLLRSEWDERAASPYRDYFVASDPQWDNPEQMDREARTAVEFLVTGMDTSALAASSVLEIGCGTGRLVGHLLDRARDYTGIDISAEMIDEATSRCAKHAGARFFVSDGLHLPGPARDREYGLILAVAVFIHCPRPVIRALLASAWNHLASAGEIRFQVMANLDDPTGIEPDTAVPDRQCETAIEADAKENAAPAGAIEMIERQHYIGHRFGGDELRAFVTEITGADLELFRPHPVHFWGVIRR